MSNLLSFPNELGSLFEWFAEETKVDYECVGSGGGSVDVQLNAPLNYDIVLTDFKAWISKVVDNSLLELVAEEKTDSKIYDDPENWDDQPDLEEALKFAKWSWGEMNGSAIWPQPNGRVFICDGCHCETGEPLTPSELPPGAYILTDNPIYDDPKDWMECSPFAAAMDTAELTWGKWVGTAVWPQGRDKYLICNGCHKDTGKPLTDEELPQGAYIVT